MKEIVIEKMREEDIQEQLMEAFNIVLEGRTETQNIASDDFK